MLLLPKTFIVKIPLLALAFALLFIHCKNKDAQAPAAPAQGDPAMPELPEGFAEFYQRFHSDSLFQISHIVFPLEGLPDNADSTALANSDFRWTLDSWHMQHQVDFTMSEFKREIVPLTKSLVVERIYDPQKGLGMLRKFALVSGGEWNLIYYAGVNRLAN